MNKKWKTVKKMSEGLPMEMWVHILNCCEDNKSRKNLSQTCRDLYYELLKKESKPIIKQSRLNRTETYMRYGYLHNIHRDEKNHFPSKIVYNNGMIKSMYFSLYGNTDTKIMFLNNGIKMVVHREKVETKEVNSDSENSDIGTNKKANRNEEKTKEINDDGEEETKEKSQISTSTYDKNGKLHQKVTTCGDKRTKTLYYDNGKPREIVFYNGQETRVNDRGIAFEHFIRHDRNKPSVVEWHPNGQKRKKVWYINGKKSREGKPAEIWWYSNGTKRYEMWYKDGQLHREEEFEDLFPAKTHWCEDGTKYYEIWYKNGNRYRIR